MNKEGLHRGSVSSTPPLPSLECSPRRNSTGKKTSRDLISESQIDGKVLPNYLRTSTSSCHDFCKYGKEHTFEAKERRPTFPKAPGNGAAPGIRADTIKSSSFGSGRKLSTKKGPFSGSTVGGTKVTDKKVVAARKEVKSVGVAKTIEKSPPMKDILSSDEGSDDELHFRTIDNIQEPNLTIHVSPSLENTTLSDDIEVIKPDLSIITSEVGDDLEEKRLEQTSFDNEVIKVETAVAEKIGSPKELKPVKQNIEMGNQSHANKPVRKISASRKPNKGMGNPSPANKSLESAKTRVNRQAIIHGRKGLGSDSVQAGGTLTQRRAKPVVPTLSSSSPAKGMPGNVPATKKSVIGLRSSLVKRERQLPTKTSIPSKVHANQFSDLKSKTSAAAKGPSLRGELKRAVIHTVSRVSSLRGGRRAVVETFTEKAEEKTLYVIESKQTSEASSRAKSKATNSLSGTPTTDPVPLNTSQLPTNIEVSENAPEYLGMEDDSTPEDDAIEILDVNDEKRVKRGEKERSQERESAVIKLKFRRGKVVNVQSESNTPWKLRFRRGTVMGNSPDVKGKADRRSFWRKEQSAEDSSKAGYKPPKVVLRHQDARQKKDTKSLFNHVIEETASKLVETRKSKVKALVGAFETVISLQESKPVPAL